MPSGFVYMMSSRERTALYIGVTSDLQRRVMEHRKGKGGKFTSKYHCFDLVYYEHHHTITGAIAREKQLKNWHREWKLNLAKKENPYLKDLSREIGIEPEDLIDLK